MPADTKAIRYEWFMTMKEDEQIIKLVWEPEDKKIESSMTLGSIQFHVKNEDNEQWHPIKNSGELPFAAAEGLARREGFHVEVPIYE